MYEQIKSQTPNAATIIFDYPILLSGNECSAASVNLPIVGGKISSAEQAALRIATQNVNDVIREAAAESGVHFVSVEDSFNGHGVCANGSNWILGIFLSKANQQSSFHPTKQGQVEYARLGNEYISEHLTGWSFGYTTSGLPKNPDPIAAPQQLQVQQLQTQQLMSPLPEFGDLNVQFVNTPVNCSNSTSIIVPGEQINIQGEGFAPNEPVDISLSIDDQDIAIVTVNADASGILDTPITIPNTISQSNGIATIEALAAGPNGVGILLLELVSIFDSTTLDSDFDGVT